MSSGNRCYKLVIPMKLHSLNEYIGACRRNPHAGANMKKQDQQAVEWYVRSQLKGVHIRKPVRMSYTWHETSRRRDLDNISSYGRKIIQDALVTCKVIEDDGWKQVTGFTDEFAIDKKHAFIEVKIMEV